MGKVLGKRGVGLAEIDFSAQVRKGGDTYGSYAPEVDVSSCGDSVAQALSRLREAVSLFLEECSRKGTLDAILSESGFAKRGRSYRPRRIIIRAKVRMTVRLAS